MGKSNVLKSMLITVGGSGKIPRTSEIAPVKKPFEVDMEQLNLIMRTPTLTVKMVSPIDGHTITLNRKNEASMKKLYQAWLTEKSRVDAEVEAQAAESEADKIPLTDEEKREIEFEKKTGAIPANAGTLTKSQVQAAVDSAFAAITSEPTKIEPVKSAVKSVGDVAHKKD